MNETGLVGRHLKALSRLQLEPDSSIDKAQIDNSSYWFRNITQEDISKVAEAVKNAIDYIQKFDPDYIVITGSSRRILMSFLQGANLGRAKILILFPAENKRVYGRGKQDNIPLHRESLNWYEQRSYVLTQMIEQKSGETLNGKKVLILEDYIDLGVKARDYLQILSQINGLKDYRFLSISKSDDNSAATTIGFDQLSKYRSATKTSIPLLRHLEDLLRITDPVRNRLEGRSVKKETEPHFKRILRDIIIAVREQKNG